MKISVVNLDDELLYVKFYSLQNYEIRLCKNKRMATNYDGVSLEFLLDELQNDRGIKKVQQVR